jgi:hypothetical protein
MYKLTGVVNGSFVPEETPHHIGVNNALTIPFQVGHLDAHVDVHQYDPTFKSSSLWYRYYGRSGSMPYGQTQHFWDQTPRDQKTGYDTDEDKR